MEYLSVRAIFSKVIIIIIIIIIIITFIHIMNLVF